MDYRSRLYQINSPTKIITSKEKYSDLYNQINSTEHTSNQKSTFGIPCSDQMLLLYGMQAKVFEKNPKPKDFPSKLKETRRNFLNNTIEDCSSACFYNRHKILNCPKPFQTKYCELAKYTGTDLKLTSQACNSYTPIRTLPLSKSNLRQPETKADRIKREIMSSFTSSNDNEVSQFKNCFLKQQERKGLTRDKSITYGRY